MKLREQAVFVLALGVCGLAVARLPDVPYVFAATTGRIVLETTAGLIAALTAFLVFLRFRRSSSLDDLTIVYAFAVLAAGNLAASLLPGVLVLDDTDDLASRLKLSTGLIGAVALTVAAVSREQPGLRASRLVALGAAVLGPVVAAVLNATVAEGSVRVVVHLITAALFAVTAYGFVVSAEHREDALGATVGVGAVLAVVSRILYSFEPDYGIDEVHIGDFVRLGFYLLLLVGAVREIRGHWQGVGMLEERRRLARELHDGLSQELAFIATQARRAPDAIGLYQIAGAAERALDESRRAISALTRPVDEPLDVALAHTAEDVAGRAGLHVELDLTEGVVVAPAVREALLRIAREAVGNAARHAGASTVRVTLRPSPLCVSVSDDGHGFSPESLAERARGFGLVSMRERAHALGASISLRSSPGEGTTVEVVMQ